MDPDRPDSMGVKFAAIACGCYLGAIFIAAIATYAKSARGWVYHEEVVFYIIALIVMFVGYGFILGKMTPILSLARRNLLVRVVTGVEFLLGSWAVAALAGMFGFFMIEEQLGENTIFTFLGVILTGLLFGLLVLVSAALGLAALGFVFGFPSPDWILRKQADEGSTSTEVSRQQEN